MRKLVYCLMACTLLAVSCKKDKDFVQATVIDTGDVTDMGCGWVLRMADGRTEKPVQMPSAFQYNHLKVKVKFHSSGILDTCRSIPPRQFYELIYIDDIKRDL